MTDDHKSRVGHPPVANCKEPREQIFSGSASQLGGSVQSRTSTTTEQMKHSRMIGTDWKQEDSAESEHDASPLAPPREGAVWPRHRAPGI
ncbi:hypothetical protein JZ751_013159 [Albula glossodonta]|uniref:Uncharacterized protein n=1 Tax=Albula glossodonta TaxID=121402 RepID=A0A8T2P2C7_9TELE|nr:hypothetical protein JZ751_013159 [Albula glossodonta]